MTSTVPFVSNGVANGNGNGNGSLNPQISARIRERQKTRYMCSKIGSNLNLDKIKPKIHDMF